MIQFRWKNVWLPFEKVEWSGTDTQCSRQITVTLQSNPYDGSVENPAIALGDLVYLYDGTAQIFVGTVTTREKQAEIGTATYTAMDFMHHLLRSKASKKFKKLTPEKITAKLCTEIGAGTESLATTKTKIAKLIFEDKSYYDMIITAYRKARAKTKKNYIPVMKGNKVSVIEKGQASGVTLTQGVNVTDATYTDTTDNMVNTVKIYNASMKKIGQVSAGADVSKYGVYQETEKKEKGSDAKKKAKAKLVGVTKEASIESIGDIRAISGKSIIIRDNAAGLSGTFFIKSDTHTFSDGTHTMKLDLSWKNEMEEGTSTSKASGKKELTNSAKCYYLSGSTVYHSSATCSACKGKKTAKSTVAKMKQKKITKGKNKGKRKYKPCSRCWTT
nr:MAG TPA: 43 kDa tail protein [Caudoviricetes sp.]